MASEFDAEGNFVKHITDLASRPHFEKIMSKYFELYVLEE